MESRRRTNRGRTLAVLALAALGAAARPAGEDLRIVGRVVDAESGAPLQGAQVYVAETLVGVLTDADGRYALTLREGALPPGEIQVVAVLIGYAWDSVTLDARKRPGVAETTVDFRLRQQSISLDEIVVAGDAAARREAQPARSMEQRRGPPPPLARTKAVPAIEVPATRAPASPAPGSGAPLPEARHDARRWNGRGGFDREQYGHIEENDFLAVADQPLSTFSIDVDRASYANVRRFLQRERRLPPIDAVQIEEMVNYFAYEYELPRGDDPLALTTELGDAPWNPRHRLLRVGLASRPVAAADMPPANLVFLMDVSGSMASDDKLPLAQDAMRLLVHRLRPQDRVAIVVYAGAAGLVLESTSGAHKGEILDAIDRLQAGGSTAGGEGLRLAYAVARRSWHKGGNNRVILATDGDFNVGESSDAAMVRLVTDERERGTFLSVLGFGTGNLQNEKMQSIAQNGNGNYAYIDGIQEARKVLVREMGGTLLTVAKDVKVQVEFNPARVASYRLLGYENRLLAAEDFNDDRKDAGEVGAGHTVTALYEIVPTGIGEDGEGRVDPLRYQTTPRSRTVERTVEHSVELAFVKVRYKRPQGRDSRLIQREVRAGGGGRSTDFRFASAVAGFGMLLRGSEHAGDLSAEDVLELGESGLGSDPDGSRREFLELVRIYRTLAGDRIAHRRR